MIARSGASPADRSNLSYQCPTVRRVASTPLLEVTFVVLDLETTGGAPDGNGITEVGAVKVRGGEPLGEFATLVNPGGPIPPFITVLTGITEAMVLPAPPIAEVLPPLLEFLGDAVFVAHNAPFDTGFLKAACAAHGYPLARPAGGRHRRAGPPAPARRRGAQQQAGHAGPTLSHARPGRPTGRWTTPGPRSTCCTR